MATALLASDVQTIITNLENAIGGGIIEIAFEGRKVRYDTLQAKIEALNYFRQRFEVLNAANTATRSSRIIRMYASKGL